MKRFYRIIERDKEYSGWMTKVEAERLSKALTGKVKGRPWIVDLLAPMTQWQAFWYGAFLAALADLVIVLIFGK